MGFYSGLAIGLVIGAAIPVVVFFLVGWSFTPDKKPSR